MMLSAILLLVVMSVDLSLTATLNDPCHLSNLGRFNNETLHNKPVMNVTIQPKCNAGEFDWDWPQGYIYLSVTLPDKPHFLCIETTQFGAVMLGGVADVTGGKHNQLELPTQDHPACSVVTTGKTELLVEAFRSQLYWTTFGYKVNLL